MRIRLLNAAGARQLYESRMARDFPPGELKPFATMEELLAAGLYEPLTFTDDAGAVLAYAWQVVLPGQQAGLVDYFACLLYTSPSPRDRSLSRMPSSA